MHAFLYNQGDFHDLNDLIPSSSDIILTSAMGIDALGRIIAIGSPPRGLDDQLYLLTPTTIPEPSTLAFASLMIAATAIRRLRRSFV